MRWSLGFGPFRRSRARYWLPGVSRSGQIFELFEILGGAGDIYNSSSTPKYCDEPYGDLGMYVNKVLSAWTLFWSGALLSTAPIMSPGGCDLLENILIPSNILVSNVPR